MELDAQTLAVLHGTDKPRNTEAYGVDGANYRVITRPGRSLRYVPPFALDDLQLRAVITQVSLSYIFRNKKVPAGFGTDLNSLEKAAADDWMATIACVAYRSWRLRWHVSDVANSLAMKDTAVMTLLYKLRRQAELMGFPVDKPVHPGRRHGTDEEILAAWNEGKAIGAIREMTGASKARIRLLLKKKGVWYRRGTPRPKQKGVVYGRGTTQQKVSCA